MNNTIKLTEQELTLLLESQQQDQKLRLELGNLEIAQFELLERKEALKLQYTNHKKKDSTILETLTSKYGIGEINLDTGEFIPR